MFTFLFFINNILSMKNALENYRRQHGLTYRALTDACKGRSLFAVYQHCNCDRIPAESAVLYADSLGIPRSELRPDLWPSPQEIIPDGVPALHVQATAAAAAE